MYCVMRASVTSLDNVYRCYDRVEGGLQNVLFRQLLSANEEHSNNDTWQEISRRSLHSMTCN